MLEYKHEIMDSELKLFEKYPFETPLKILISGSHGLIGKNLCYLLEGAGHEVWRLVRSGGAKGEIVWDPETGEGKSEEFEGFDAVIHLAGENIGTGRWTEEKKERIVSSRVKGTENLALILKKLKAPPKTFICASAMGYYGDRGDVVLNEESGPGFGCFITELCQAWEQATHDLEEIGMRVVHSRFGLVLTPVEGALKKMLLPFKCGLGGYLGSGKQYMSWIAIDDAIWALYHILMTTELSGPVNVTAPYPVTNREFSKKLAKRLGRWLGPPMPEFMVRLICGQFGEELLLASTRMEPASLLKSGYTFRYPKLTQAFEHIL